MSKAHVIVYSRPGCHLCDEAKAVIKNSGLNDQFTFAEINIESDNELLRKYKHDIPVVTIDGVETFKHRVNLRAFQNIISHDKTTLFISHKKGTRDK